MMTGPSFGVDGKHGKVPSQLQGHRQHQKQRSQTPAAAGEGSRRTFLWRRLGPKGEGGSGFLLRFCVEFTCAPHVFQHVSLTTR